MVVLDTKPPKNEVLKIGDSIIWLVAILIVTTVTVTVTVIAVAIVVKIIILACWLVD